MSAHLPTCQSLLILFLEFSYGGLLACSVSARLFIQVVTHACEHVNIPEYVEHFKVYMDLGNQGATNAG